MGVVTVDINGGDPIDLTDQAKVAYAPHPSGETTDFWGRRLSELFQKEHGSDQVTGGLDPHEVLACHETLRKDS